MFPSCTQTFGPALPIVSAAWRRRTQQHVEDSLSQKGAICAVPFVYLAPRTAPIDPYSGNNKSKTKQNQKKNQRSQRHLPSSQTKREDQRERRKKFNCLLSSRNNLHRYATPERLINAGGDLYPARRAAEVDLAR